MARHWHRNGTATRTRDHDGAPGPRHPGAPSACPCGVGVSGGEPLRRGVVSRVGATTFLYIYSSDKDSGKRPHKRQNSTLNKRIWQRPENAEIPLTSGVGSCRVRVVDDAPADYPAKVHISS